MRAVFRIFSVSFAAMLLLSALRAGGEEIIDPITGTITVIDRESNDIARFIFPENQAPLYTIIDYEPDVPAFFTVPEEFWVIDYTPIGTYSLLHFEFPQPGPDTFFVQANFAPFNSGLSANIETAPEPSTLPLLGIGLVCSGWFLLRCKRTNRTRRLQHQVN